MIFQKRNFPIIVLCLLISFFSCKKDTKFKKEVFIRDNNFVGILKVEWLDKPRLYKISIQNKQTGKSDRIYIPFEIFDLQTGDINGDGSIDFCLGLIKPTPHDPTMKKRLFIFKIDRDYIRPLWLGSRLWHTYEQFRVIESKPTCLVRSIEVTGSQSYMVNEYSWKSFGLSWIRSKGDSLSLNQATKLLLE